MNRRIDLRNVGQIVSAIGLLHVFPSEEKAGEFLVPLLTSLPGCHAASLCFRRLDGPVGDLKGEQCPACVTAQRQLAETNQYACRLVEQDKVLAYPLETSVQQYGHLILSVQNLDEYRQYEPFVRNLGNVLAIILENRRQQQELLEGRTLLEQRVTERTEELRQANEELRKEITNRKQAEEALQRNQRLLVETERIGKVGGWEFNIATEKQTWTHEIYHIHEVEYTFDPTVEKGVGFYTAESRPIVERAVQRAIEHGEPFDLELEIVTAKGNLRSVHAIGESDIERLRIHGFFQDITDRKRTEEALRRSEEKFRSIYEDSPIGIEFYDREGTLSDANRACLEIFGISDVSAIKGFKLFEDPNLTEELKAQLRRCEIVSYEIPFDFEKVRALQLYETTKNGTIYLDLLITPLRDATNESAIGYLVHIRDITERKRAGEKLRESEEQFSSAFEFASIGMALVSPEGKWLRVNHATCDLLGYSEPDFLSSTFQDITHPDDLTADLTNVGQMLAGIIRTYQMEKRYIHKQGHTIWALLSVSMLRDRQGKPRYFISQIVDITERKRMEEALQESEERFKKLFVEAPLGIALIDSLTGHISEVNPMFAKIAGRTMEEMVQIDWMSITHPDDVQENLDNMALLNAGEINGFQMEKRYLHHDGTVVWINMTVAKVEIEDIDKAHPRHFCMIEDITKRKKAEADKEKLEAKNRQLQKSESLGRMAGAIAHTFNNQLGVVIGNLEMAIDYLPEGAGPVHNLTAAMRAANKAAEVSGQMLTYLGQSFDKHELMDLAEVCRRNLPILEASMPGTVALETDLPSLGPVVTANASEIQQVLTNLITNAWEAADASRGSIHLIVKIVSQADIPRARRFPVGWQPKDSAYACLGVTDTGNGIADKDIEKIFDPFFSTKFTGRGLGLAMVLGIVKAHNGAITVESEPGKGSAFQIFLPLSVDEVSWQPDQVTQPLPTKGGGTVLLVEDEEMLRDMAAAMLTRLGFTVLAARDGIEAVELFNEHEDEIRLVLSDLTMPHMDGWETLAALRKLAPNIPVILASGYDKARVMAGDHPELPQVFLGKPYKLKELGDAIGQALLGKK